MPNSPVSTASSTPLPGDPRRGHRTRSFRPVPRTRAGFASAHRATSPDTRRLWTRVWNVALASIGAEPIVAHRSALDQNRRTPTRRPARARASCTPAPDARIDSPSEWACVAPVCCSGRSTSERTRTLPPLSDPSPTATRQCPRWLSEASTWSIRALAVSTRLPPRQAARRLPSDTASAGPLGLERPRDPRRR